MRTALATALFALSAVGLTAQDDKTDAKKYESKEGKYTVGFPGTPKTETKKTTTIDLHIAIVEKATGGFAVIHSDLPAEANKAKPKDLLDGGEKGLINNFGAKVTTSKDVEFGKQKYPAREILAEKGEINLRITIILAENRLYQVFVVGPKELVGGKDADAFFQSFEIKK